MGAPSPNSNGGGGEDNALSRVKSVAIDQPDYSTLTSHGLTTAPPGASG